MDSYTHKSPNERELSFVTKKTFIRLINFILAKIQNFPAYELEIEAFVKGKKQGSKEKKPYLIEIVTFEHYLFQNLGEVREQLQIILNYLVVNLALSGGNQQESSYDNVTDKSENSLQILSATIMIVMTIMRRLENIRRCKTIRLNY